jgi:hypothetical protein
MRPREDGSVGRLGRLRRSLLPTLLSSRHALAVLILGFVVEGGTEAYQFLQRGNLAQGWVEYYVSLGTTILGFVMMFLGLREWHALYPRRMQGGAVGRRLGRPWSDVTLWAVGTAATAILSLALGGQEAGFAPLWVVGPVGGLVVLAFGSFFSGLWSLARTVSPPVGRVLGGAAWVWSLGVAVVAGLVIGDRAVLFLVEFLTNWGALIASLAPVVVAMSPLVVAYGLLAATYWLAREELP